MKKFWKQQYKKVEDKWLSVDAFARPIQLNFKGQTEIKTLGGAIVSIFFRLIVLLIVITRVMSVAERGPDEIQSFKEILPPDQIVNFEQSGNFTFLVGFSNLFLQKVGNLRVTQDTYKNGQLVYSKPIDIVVCSDLNPGVATTNKEFDGVVFEDYYMYCPVDNAEIDLSGNHL